MAVLCNNVIAGASIADDASGDGYQIEKSLRLNSADSAYLNTTFGLGNRRMFTWSGWVKRSKPGAFRPVFMMPYSSNGNDAFYFCFDSSDADSIQVGQYTTSWQFELITDAVFRDASAWYHVCLAVDTNNSIASERIRLWVNGNPQTWKSGSQPSQNLELFLNNNVQHDIGRLKVWAGNSSGFADYYLADVNFIDGLALSPSAVGSFASTGVWNPKAFALPTPNANTTWTPSSGGPTNPGNMFDGDVSTYATLQSSAGTKTITTQELTVNASLRVKIGAGSGYYYDWTINGTTYRVSTSAGAGWYDIPIPKPLTITSFTGAFGASSGDYIYGWEVDGVILVDGQTDKTYDETVTAGGPGRTWSTDLSTNGTMSNANQGFDGNTGTRAQTANAGTNKTLTWAPSPPVRFSSKLEVYCDQGDSTPKAEWNGNSVSPGGGAWVTVYTGSGEISAAKPLVIDSKTASQYATLKGVRLDNTIITDGTPFSGADFSKNSFHLKFNDISRNSYLGKDTLNGKIADATGGLPFYNTDATGDVKGSGYRADSSAGTTDGTGLILALPGDVLTDEHDHVNTGSSAHTVTNNSSNVTVTTDQSRLYGSSLDFGAGHANNYLALPDHTDFEFGTGDFCIEAWIRCTSASQANNIWSQRNSSHEGISFRIDTSKRVDYFNDNSATVSINSGSNTITLNTWNHVAVTRASSTTKLWLNGIEVASVSDSTDYDSNTIAPRIGGSEALTYEFFSGQIQDLRVYKGVAKYTANFTAPNRNDFTVNNLTSEVGTTSWGGAKTVTATSGATTTTSNTKFYGTSKDLDGSNDYINTQTSDDWNFPGEFTVELWFRPEATTGIRPLIAARDSDSGWCFGYWPGTSGKLAFYTGGSPATDVEVTWTPSSLFTNTWTHVAVTRNSSNTLTIWVNGDDKATSTVTGTLTVESDDPIQIGNVWPSGMDQYDGQFSDIRIYKGVCKYVADFTVPDGSTSVASATGGLPIRNTSGTNGETALTGFRADVIPGTSTDVSQNLVLAIPGNTYEDVSGQIRKAAPVDLDSLTDSPTNYGTDTGAGGEVRGNYCTWNPLTNYSDATLSNGNLDVTATAEQFRAVVGTIFPTSGKWYFETTITGRASDQNVGIAADTFIPSGSDNRYAGRTTDSWGFYSDGRKIYNNTFTSYGSAWAVGDVLGIAYDLDAGKMWFAINNTWQVSGNPATGANETFSGITGAVGPACAPYGPSGNRGTFHLNTGQRAFKYTAPSGFKALCTQNLDDTFSGAELNNPSKYFDIKTWSGQSSGVLTIKGYDFSPDTVWIKIRSGTSNWRWADRLRGAGKSLLHDAADGEYTNVGSGHVDSFTDDGFTLEGAVYLNAL